MFLLFKNRKHISLPSALPLFYLTSHWSYVWPTIAKYQLLCGDSRFDENKNKIIMQSSIRSLRKLKDSWDHFLNKVHPLLKAVINIFSELSWFMFPQFLFFNFTDFIFLLTYFVSPSNSHYCYCNTFECIFSCILFLLTYYRKKDLICNCKFIRRLRRKVKNNFVIQMMLIKFP